MDLKNKQLTSFLNFIKKYAVSIFLLCAFSLFMLFGGWSWISESSIYGFIIKSISTVLAYSTLGLLNLFGYATHYNSESLLFTVVGENSVLIYPYVAEKYYFLILLLFVLFPKNKNRSIYYVTCGILLVFFISIYKLLIISLLSESIYGYQLSDPTNLFIKTLFFLLILLKLRLFNNINYYFNTLNKRANERFSVSILVLIVFLPFFIHIHKIIDLISIESNLAILLNQILYLSHKTLTLVGYPEAIIVNNCLYLDINYVCVGTQCLGIGIMTSFSFLILLIRSPWLNKLFYILMGISVIICMNAVRMSYLLIYIYKNKRYDLAMEVHDLSNYFFYAVVFLMFLVYILWFQYIPFFKKKADKVI